ncbi:hypothetical protein FA13DRAFT_1806244 [Coprinellus micaceus]|uniref:F-box domain-containing protein n=1 Tax=Coprinellus micaceus TaxID=71717 RepID=A0A4Y7RPF9_COPMI|nr:hypothetical protein FA13DRAFT_1806244 [Coprinellus micaceus]
MPPSWPLSLNLWRMIGQRCSIEGLISLASTCRDLYTALNTKHVWKNLLMDACEETGVIAGTYNTEEMTLQDIRQALRRPQTWSTLVSRRPARYYPTFDGTIPKASPMVQMRKALYEQMTPGGRFLTRVQDINQTFTLQMFRLAPPAEAHTIRLPVIVAEHVIQGNCGYPLKVTSCTTRNTVLVSLTWHDTKLYHSFVYHIVPSTETVWRIFAQLTFTHSPDIVDICMTCEYIHFDLGDGYVLSWHFRDTKALKWRKCGRTSPIRLIAHPQAVLMCLPDRIAVFSHSSLASRLSIPQEQHDDYLALTPNDVLPHPGFHAVACDLPSTPRLNPTPQNPLVFDLSIGSSKQPFSIVEVQDAGGGIKLELRRVALVGEIGLDFNLQGQRRIVMKRTSYSDQNPTTESTALRAKLYERQVEEEVHPKGRVDEYAWADFLP